MILAHSLGVQGDCCSGSYAFGGVIMDYTSACIVFVANSCDSKLESKRILVTGALDGDQA
jgi:hypothetical protein